MVGFSIKPILYWETSIITSGRPINRRRMVNQVVMNDPEDGGAYVEGRDLEEGETIIDNTPAPAGSYKVCATAFPSEEEMEAGHDENWVNDLEVAVFVGRTTPFDENDFHRWIGPVLRGADAMKMIMKR